MNTKLDTNRQFSVFLWLYIGISLAELATHLIPQLLDFHFITKPMLMVLLGLHVYQMRKGHFDNQDKLLLVSLLFSWLGDVALMFTDALSFMLGLGAFLIAHLLYIVVFGKFEGESSIKKQPFVLIPFVIYGIGLMYAIFPQLKEMLVPVFVYALVLLSMVVAAYNTKYKISPDSFNWLMFGALSFMISDSLIAINKFATPLPVAAFLIMSSYLFGQYGIVKGYLLGKDVERP